jgi:hypothetical protein
MAVPRLFLYSLPKRVSIPTCMSPAQERRVGACKEDAAGSWAASDASASRQFVRLPRRDGTGILYKRITSAATSQASPRCRPGRRSAQGENARRVAHTRPRERPSWAATRKRAGRGVVLRVRSTRGLVRDRVRDLACGRFDHSRMRSCVPSIKVADHCPEARADAKPMSFQERSSCIGIGANAVPERFSEFSRP